MWGMRGQHMCVCVCVCLCVNVCQVSKHGAKCTVEAAFVWKGLCGDFEYVYDRQVAMKTQHSAHSEPINGQ